MKKQIIAATALMLAISSTAYASDNINIFVNGNALNTGAFIMNDSTYIPLRAVSEALGSNVNWDGNTRSVYIDSDEDTVTAQVIENASSSVVAIVGNYKPEYMTGTVSNYNELTAHGTGVVIKSGGIILTNAHVVSDIDNITVVFRRRKLCRTNSGNRQRFRLGFGKGWPSWFKANIVRTIGQYLCRAVRCCNRYSPFAFNAKQCIKRYRKRT